MINRCNRHFYSVRKAAPFSKVLKSFPQGHKGEKKDKLFPNGAQFPPHSHSMLFSDWAAQQLRACVALWGTQQ